MVNRILVYDDMDEFFDAYFFNTPVNKEEIEKTIIEVKKSIEGEWTLDDIRKVICEKFNVKEVILFDNTGFANCGVIEVNSINKQLEVK